jgi:hypothetical protein
MASTMTVGLPGLVGQPVRGGPGPGLKSDVVGGGEDPQLGGRDPGLDPGQVTQRRLLLGGGQVDRVHREDLVQRAVQDADREPRTAGHTTTQAPATDIGRGSEPFVHRVFQDFTAAVLRLTAGHPCAPQPPEVAALTVSARLRSTRGKRPDTFPSSRQIRPSGATSGYGRSRCACSRTQRASPAAHSWLPSATHVRWGSTPAWANDSSMAIVASIRVAMDSATSKDGSPP